MSQADRACRFQGWTMVAIVFLSFNCAAGIIYGSYGILLTSFQERFHTSRGLASAGLSAMALVLSLVAPYFGVLIQRWSLRFVMIIGALLGAVGHFLLTMTWNIYAFLLIYGVFFGCALAALGIGGSTLISRWFVRGRGMALGIMYVPAVMSVLPSIVGSILLRYGARMVLLTNAALYLLLIPILLMIVDRPGDVGQQPRGAMDAPGSTPTSASTILRISQVVLRSDFWLLCIGGGLLSGVGIMLQTHLVPLATSKGFDLPTASRMFSFYGIALMGGALLFGWLSDRVGPTAAYICNASLLLLPCVGLLVLRPSVKIYTVLLMLMALSIAGAATASVGSINVIFGREKVSQIMGFSTLAKLPFILAAAPLAGFIFDESGSYDGAILTADFAVAISIVALIVLHARRLDTNTS
jgi:MFS family permease